MFANHEQPLQPVNGQFASRPPIDLTALNQGELAAHIREVGPKPFIRSFTPEICRQLLGRGDLHVHSSLSDGTDPPLSLAVKAAAAGIAAPTR